MPSLSERHRNNVRAGVFVSVALILGMLIIIAVSGFIERFGRQHTSYKVRFPVKSGVANLKEGSDVRVGGVAMGRVTEVEPQFEVEPFQTIKVQFKVDSRVTLFENAVILVGAPLLGSDAWLEIPNVGTKDQPPVPPHGEIQGAEGAGMLTSLLGADNKEKAGEIVENFRVVSLNARDFSEVFPQFRGDYDAKIVPILDNVKELSSDAKSVVLDLREKRWPNWAEKVDQIMQWAVDMRGRIDEALAKGDDMLGQGRDMVAENRPNIKDITGNVRAATERINEETIEKVHQLLDGGQHGIDQAIAILENLRVDYQGWSTNVGDALANANLASQQLKLATVEVRRSPWKLLYRPTADELQHEFLYEATRSFAVAAADLKAAAASVQRVLDQTSGGTPPMTLDQDTIERLQKHLVESLDRYQTAQQQLIDVLLTEPGTQK